MSQVSTQFDSPWKDIIVSYFEAFMVFFFPEIHQLIDWNSKYHFMDSELQKVVRDAKIKRRLADKLVKVLLKNGKPTILYIHLEVQGQKDKDFEKRMFTYNYRIFDRYGFPVSSLAILGDDNVNWRPSSYSYGAGNTKMSCQFSTVKLIDYLDHWEALEKSSNPFAIVVQTHLKGLETHKSSSGKKRLEEKKALFKALYEAHYSEQQILDLFHFMVWVLGLPKNLEQQFNHFVTQYEEEKKMPYITSIERFGIEKGRQEGRREGLQEGLQKVQESILQKARDYVVESLKVRFKRVPKALIQQIQALEDEALLSKLHKEAILIDSLKSFKQVLKNIQS